MLGCPANCPAEIPAAVQDYSDDIRPKSSVLSGSDFDGEERHCVPFLSPEKVELPQLGERVGTAHGVFLCPDWGQVTQHPLQLDFLQQKLNFPFSLHADLSFLSAKHSYGVERFDVSAWDPSIYLTFVSPPCSTFSSAS